MKRLRIDVLVVLLALGFTSFARAQDDDAAARAKAEFVHGTELVRAAQWAEALAAFERASQVRSHAVTTYNMGVCQRAMGQYVRARKTFLQALAENDAAGGAQLSGALRDDTQSLIKDVDALLTTLTVTVDPPTAAVTVDGKPLSIETAQGVPVLVAGLRAPGAGEAPPAPTFRVRLDPGAHVIAFARKGYSDAVFNKVLAPGSSSELSAHLDNLPATLHIASQPAGAVVVVAGTDVGLSPVDVIRPAGTYPIALKKLGYVTYEAQLTARAGEDLSVRPLLPLEKKSIAQRWWFWTGIGVLVAGAVVGTALGVSASQPKTRPAPFTGGLGWSVPAQ